MKFTPPPEVSAVLSAFASLFTRPTWTRVQALVCGALLASTGTVTAALRSAMHLGGKPHFQNFHRALNRAQWSTLKAVPILLVLLHQSLSQGKPITARSAAWHPNAVPTFSDALAACVD